MRCMSLSSMARSSLNLSMRQRMSSAPPGPGLRKIRKSRAWARVTCPCDFISTEQPATKMSSIVVLVVNSSHLIRQIYIYDCGDGGRREGWDCRWVSTQFSLSRLQFYSFLVLMFYIFQVSEANIYMTCAARANSSRRRIVSSFAWSFVSSNYVLLDCHNE
jgi:hypothetical protein